MNDRKEVLDLDSTELFYPEIRVSVGRYGFTKGITTEVYSSQDSYSDWAKIRFTEQFTNKLSIAKMEQAVIQLGYDGVFDEVFQGYVAQPYNAGTSLNEIALRDAAMRLEATDITNTFLNTTPQEMLTFCLRQAGITDIQLSGEAFPVKKRVPVFKKNIIDAINEIHSVWGIKKPFFFSGGVFYWGVKPAQQQTYNFQYGVNIISLNRVGGAWELETVSVPFIKHSHVINVTHPKTTGTFEVKKVVFLTNESGFIRTYIYF